MHTFLHSAKRILYPVHADKDDDTQNRELDPCQVIAGSNRHTYGRKYPYRGCRCDTDYKTISGHHHAGTEETDSGYYLPNDTRRIGGSGSDGV